METGGRPQPWGPAAEEPPPREPDPTEAALPAHRVLARASQGAAPRLTGFLSLCPLLLREARELDTGEEAGSTCGGTPAPSQAEPGKKGRRASRGGFSQAPLPPDPRRKAVTLASLVHLREARGRTFVFCYKAERASVGCAPSGFFCFNCFLVQFSRRKLKSLILSSHTVIPGSHSGLEIPLSVKKKEKNI